MESFGWYRYAPRLGERGPWRHRLAGAGRAAAAWTRRAEQNPGILRENKPAAKGLRGANDVDLAEDGAIEVRRQRVEAVLLLSRGPVPSRKLSQLAGLADATEARTLVRQLNQVYAEQGRAFRAEEVAGGYQLMTRPQLAPWLRRLGHIPKTVQLTPPAMETMAIVAYRQPVLRADIEAIRGVACGEILRQLMERDLVRISGRSEELGRPYLYSTTKRFLQIFGLRGADALPALDEPEIDISEHPDWSDANVSADPNPDQHSVPGAPEEESDVSTAVANLVSDEPECDNDASVELTNFRIANPRAATGDEEEDDELFVDDEDDVEVEDDEEVFDEEDEDDWDEEDDEADELEEDDEEDVDAEWEEVDDEEWEEDDEAEDEEAEEDAEDDIEDDDWDEEDDAVVEDDDEDEEEWD